MKQHFLIPLFLLSSLMVSAQIPVALDRLEGRWISGNIISDWHFTDDYALNNRTFRIVSGDTTEISRTYIRSDKNGVTTLTYVGANGESHQFELAVADVYGSTWRNVQTDALPSCLKLERIALNKYLWSGIGEPLEFKREKEGKPKVRLGILLGTTNYFSLQKGPVSASSKFVPKPGYETAVSAGFYRPNSNISLIVEGGMKVFNQDIERIVHDKSGQAFAYSGTESLRVPYLSIAPESRFGKNEQFRFSTGILVNIAAQKTFKGGYMGAQPTENMLPLPVTKVKNNFGFFAGLGYHPHLKVAGFRPGFYCRYMYRGVIMAGMKLEI